MLAEERRTKILELLHRDGSVRSSALARELEVSSETVRKDLDHLSLSGQLVRVHGGALALGSLPGAFRYRSYREREADNLDAKKAIAAEAAALVEEGQSIGLDSGTSTLFLAHALTKRFQRLTIVTNSLKNALVLAESSGFNVLVTGGQLMGDESSLVSDLAFPLVDAINLDILFLTASGITSSTLTDQRMAEILVQNRMRLRSRRSVALLDGTKFGRTAPFKICDTRDIDLVVTDISADPLRVREIAECGTPVRQALLEGQ